MSTKITKAEFDALPDSLKAQFKADGDDYVQQAVADEDVEGLKRSKAEILAEKKRIQAERDELAKFKAEQEAKAAEQDEAAMKEAGKFKELEDKLRNRISELEQQTVEIENGYKAAVKTEKLKNYLVEKGVAPDRAKYALADIGDQFDIEKGEQGFTLKLKNGIGDAKEIDAVVGQLEASSPFLFTATTPPGSGALGSGQKGGEVKVDANLSPVAKLEQIFSSGK